MTTAQFYCGFEVLEACSAVLFDPAMQKVCILRSNDGSFFLPSGRRNLEELRFHAAFRIAHASYGYSCHLQPITLLTRALRPNQPPGSDDPHQYHNISTEHFACTEIRRESKTEIRTYWYLAVANSNVPATPSREPQYTPVWLTTTEALAVIGNPEQAVLHEAIRLMNIVLWHSGRSDLRLGS